MQPHKHQNSKFSLTVILSMPIYHLPAKKSSGRKGGEVARDY